MLTLLPVLSGLIGLAASSADSAAIVQTARDYAEGWAEGNSIQAEKAVSPELAERKIFTDDHGHWFVSDMSASLLAQAARNNKDGFRSPDREPDQPFTLHIRILDISGPVASVQAWNTQYGFLD